jgi:recombination protein RecA
MLLTAEQQKTFDILQQSLNKKYGSGTINILGGNEVADLPRTSSGVLSVDQAIGGGFPDGRFIEIYGPESSGKTTLMLHALAEQQKKGRLCAYIDVEHALDLNYARNLGVDVQSLTFSQPDSAEEALDILHELIQSGIYGAIVVDSVAALVPKVEVEGTMDQSSMGVMPRLMSRICRVATPIANNNKCTVFWINQIRMKIGVMFGSPETTTGGQALKFYSSIRLDVRRRGQVKDGEDAIANETEIKVVKNKTAPPYKTCEFQIGFGTGVNKDLDLLNVAVETGVVIQSGAWFSFGGEKIGQGKPKTLEFLQSNPEVFNKIKEQVQKKMVQPLAVAHAL